MKKNCAKRDQDSLSERKKKKENEKSFRYTVSTINYGTHQSACTQQIIFQVIQISDIDA